MWIQPTELQMCLECEGKGFKIIIKSTLWEEAITEICPFCTGSGVLKVAISPSNKNYNK